MLGRFGRDAGVLLSFRPEVTQGLDSAGLRGSFTVQTGLERLLAGTGIEVRPQGAGGYVLERHGGVAQLQAITVAAQASSDGLPAPYAGGQVARGGSLGMLGSADVMDVPFNTTNYTAQTLENQQARTLADVVVNEASVRTLTSSGGFGEDFQIRGYTVSSGDVGLNGLFGLTSSSRMPAAIMERVEVLKGPGTLMNGVGPNGSIGGGINVVTKRAGDEPLTRLTATYQDKSQLGACSTWDAVSVTTRNGASASTASITTARPRSMAAVSARGWARWRWTTAASACAGRSMPIRNASAPTTSALRWASNPR
ncbi:tonB-dependent Receptor Plug domain protein [Bordetella holmesii 44057]|nr:tonB-dependent Receptor Plug domain protein [Bordetella holmesii 44057]